MPILWATSLATVARTLQMSSTNCLAGNKKLAMVQSMRIPVAVLVTWFSFHVTAASLEDVSPHFSTNAEIVWKVPANDLPKRLWIYKKLPHVFSAATISSAVILAGFQRKGFPIPSTKRTVIWDDVAGSTIGEPRPPCFAIMPENAARFASPYPDFVQNSDSPLVLGWGYSPKNLYMANWHSSGDWQFKQSVAMALPTVILKVGWVRCWAARFLPGCVAR